MATEDEPVPAFGVFSGECISEKDSTNSSPLPTDQNDVIGARVSFPKQNSSVVDEEDEEGEEGEEKEEKEQKEEEVPILDIRVVEDQEAFLVEDEEEPRVLLPVLEDVLEDRVPPLEEEETHLHSICNITNDVFIITFSGFCDLADLAGLRAGAGISIAIHDELNDGLNKPLFLVSQRISSCRDPEIADMRALLLGLVKAREKNFHRIIVEGVSPVLLKFNKYVTIDDFVSIESSNESIARSADEDAYLQHLYAEADQMLDIFIQKRFRLASEAEHAFQAAVRGSFLRDGRPAVERKLFNNCIILQFAYATGSGKFGGIAALLCRKEHGNKVELFSFNERTNVESNEVTYFRALQFSLIKAKEMGFRRIVLESLSFQIWKKVWGVMQFTSKQKQSEMYSKAFITLFNETVEVLQGFEIFQKRVLQRDDMRVHRLATEAFTMP